MVRQMSPRGKGKTGKGGEALPPAPALLNRNANFQLARCQCSALCQTTARCFYAALYGYPARCVVQHSTVKLPRLPHLSSADHPRQSPVGVQQLCDPQWAPLLAVSARTRAAYASDWREFALWCHAGRNVAASAAGGIGRGVPLVPRRHRLESEHHRSQGRGHRRQVPARQA
jgi:hypothetical protein